MKLYFQCTMGAAGDMIMAALLELLPDKASFIDTMNGLGLPGVRLENVPTVKCGIQGTKVRVTVGEDEETPHDVDLDAVHDPVGHEHSHEHEYEHGHSHAYGHSHLAESGHEGASDHKHYTYGDIRALIERLELPDRVKSDALEVYALLGEAESAVHGAPLENIHFHEVGSLDAVADIVGCSLLFHLLGVTDVSSSPVHIGSGFVRCAHGILPVPTPATAYLLRGIPMYSGSVKGELCTPTGAALLRHFVGRFGDMAPMRVRNIGYGMGTKDYDIPNCVRAFLYDEGENADEIVELSCNLDDMTPEAIGYATERLLDAGALDVFTAPIYMKKNRPAVLLTCLSRPEDRTDLSALMLRHTTTHGVRYRALRRDVLETAVRPVETAYGQIRVKTASGCGVVKSKPEYEDVKSAALRAGVPFQQVYAAALAAMQASSAE